MRNLRNYRHDKLEIPQNGAPEISSTAWDPTDDSVIFTTGPSSENPEITLNRLPEGAQDLSHASVIAQWEAPPRSPDSGADRILSLHCFPEYAQHPNSQVFDDFRMAETSHSGRGMTPKHS